MSGGDEREPHEREPHRPAAGDDTELSGAWALDALDDDERAAYEERLRRERGERREADALRETAARLGAGSAVPPPGHLRAQVLAAIAATPQEPPAQEPPGQQPPAGGRPEGEPVAGGAAPVVDLAERRRARRGPSRWSALVAAAGIAVAAAGTGVALDARGDAERAREVAAAGRAAEGTLQQVAGLLASGSASTATVQASSGGTATLVRAGDRAAVVTAGLPAPGEGSAWQLWLVQGEAVSSAGLLPAPGGDGRAVAVLPALDGATGFGISLEPAGGSVQPTTTPVVFTSLPA
ncbi:anti-sigma factor domain-containing protein [Kineococcus gypseus]|uniref:anti-sigma factor n=1 Tax=Kineococcus gypseus TaxID=1637102 RepID=UPI003D7E0E10